MPSGLLEIKEIARYKELLRNLVLRDIKKRYKRSALGFLWVMLDPLLMMLIFYLIFSQVFGREVGNYTAYVMSGISMWQLFSQGTKVSGAAFIQNRNLINKVALPKAIFPLSVVASSLVHFLFSLIPLSLIIVVSGTTISSNVVFLPFIIMLLAMFALGISLAIATLAVFFHDVIYIYDVFLMAWMYCSAIFYPVSILPEKIRILLSLNPLYHYISLFRACLYDQAAPKTEHLLVGLVFGVLSLITGWIIYRRNRDRIVFYL